MYSEQQRRGVPPTVDDRLRCTNTEMSCCTHNEGGCRCEGGDAHVRRWGLEDHPLAMVYAPLQKFDKTYDCERALKMGSLFSELVLPFEGRSITKGGCHG